MLCFHYTTAGINLARYSLFASLKRSDRSLVLDLNQLYVINVSSVSVAVSLYLKNFHDSIIAIYSTTTANTSTFITLTSIAYCEDYSTISRRSQLSFKQKQHLAFYLEKATAADYSFCNQYDRVSSYCTVCTEVRQTF